MSGSPDTQSVRVSGACRLSTSRPGPPGPGAGGQQGGPGGWQGGPPPGGQGYEQQGYGGQPGNSDSTNPVIGNAGYYITFQSGAGNLGTNALSRRSDENGKPDVYLYTDVRHITLLQSVVEKGTPLFGGGQNPSMSFYANYIVFDSPAPLDSSEGPHQIFMRYLGGL